MVSLSALLVTIGNHWNGLFILTVGMYYNNCGQTHILCNHTCLCLFRLDMLLHLISPYFFYLLLTPNFSDLYQYDDNFFRLLFVRGNV